MKSLKPFFRVRVFMFQVDDATFDDESKNNFAELSKGDDVKHPDSLLRSSKSASESDQI